MIAGLSSHPTPGAPHLHTAARGQKCDAPPSRYQRVSDCYLTTTSFFFIMFHFLFCIWASQRGSVHCDGACPIGPLRLDSQARYIY